MKVIDIGRNRLSSGSHHSPSPPRGCGINLLRTMIPYEQTIPPSLVIILQEIDLILLELDFGILVNSLLYHLHDDCILLVSELIHQVVEPLIVSVARYVPI